MKIALLAFLLPSLTLADPAWEDRQATPLRGELCFRDEDLAAFLQSVPVAAIYVWSPHLPESVAGIPDFLKAAGALRIPVVLLLDPQADGALAAKTAQDAGLPQEALRRLRSLRMIRQGALLEYPSVTVFRSGQILGTAAAGNRGAGYEPLLSRMISESPSSGRGAPATEPVAVKVRGVTPLPAADFRYGAIPLAGTRWVSVAEDTGYLFNLDDKRLVAASSPLLTPGDGRYGVFPSGASLAFAEMTDPARNLTPFFVDGAFAVRESTVGTLFAVAARAQYRVLSDGPGDAPEIRDYTVVHRNGEKAPIVKGLSQRGPACRNFATNGLGRPALSKDGRFLFANVDFPAREAAVFEMNPRDPASCSVAFTLGVPTARAGFSFDGKRLAFTALGGEAFVYEIQRRELRRLEGLGAALGPGTPLNPEFRPDGSLLLSYLKDGGGILLVELSVD